MPLPTADQRPPFLATNPSRSSASRCGRSPASTGSPRRTRSISSRRDGSAIARSASGSSTIRSPTSFSRTRSAIVHRYELTLASPGVDLARARDLLLAVLEHLLPLRDPARQAAECEQHGEVVGRVAHRLVDEAGVEVDV